MRLHIGCGDDRGLNDNLRAQTSERPTSNNASKHGHLCWRNYRSPAPFGADALHPRAAITGARRGHLQHLYTTAKANVAQHDAKLQQTFTSQVAFAFIATAGSPAFFLGHAKATWPSSWQWKQVRLPLPLALLPLPFWAWPAAALSMPH